jgi:hypothetical protein
MQLRPDSQELHSVPVSAGFERCVRLDLHDQGGRDRGVFDRIRAGQTESTAGQHRSQPITRLNTTSPTWSRLLRVVVKKR